MAANATVNRITIGCRYASDRVDLLDAITKRRGDPDRAATMRYALDRLIREHFPNERLGEDVEPSEVTDREFMAPPDEADRARMARAAKRRKAS